MNKLYTQLPAAVRGRAVPLKHETSFHLFGVPVVVASYSEALMDGVDAALGRWKSLPTSYRENIVPRRLDILVSETMSADADADAPRIAWHGRGDLLIASGRGLAAAAAGSAGTVFAAPEWALPGREFADVVLTPLAIFLASGGMAQERLFLRASAFVRGGAALVLLGKPDAARLVFAGDLHRAGLEILGTDFILAARHPARGLELWGHPSAIPPSAHTPMEDGNPPGDWSPLPLEGVSKVHLQHAGPVLLAVLDDAAPGPVAESFPARFETDPEAMRARLAALASPAYPMAAEDEEAAPDLASRSILAELAKHPAIRLPSVDPAASLPGVLRLMDTLPV
ncbi:MAG: hypothetical protein ACOCWR_01750 [Oceanidesulfovibrio sp.]